MGRKKGSQFLPCLANPDRRKTKEGDASPLTQQRREKPFTTTKEGKGRGDSLENAHLSRSSVSKSGKRALGKRDKMEQR